MAGTLASPFVVQLLNPRFLLEAFLGSRGTRCFKLLQFLLSHASHPLTFCLPLLHNVPHDPQQILQERRSRVIGQFVNETIHLRLYMQDGDLTIIDIVVHQELICSTLFF